MQIKFKNVPLMSIATSMMALALISCGGGGVSSPATAEPTAPTPTTPTPPVSTLPTLTALTQTEVQTELAQQQAMSNEARLNRLNTVQTPAVRTLVTWGGLANALGGAAKADAALDAASAQALASFNNTSRTQIDAMLGPLRAVSSSTSGGSMVRLNSNVVRADASSGVNGLMGVTMSLITSKLISGVLSSANFEHADHLESKSGEPGTQFDAIIDIARERISYRETAAMDDTKLGLRNKNVTALDQQFCPDANGQMTMKFSSDSQLTQVGNTSTGVNTQVEVTIVRQLDDTANMVNAFSAEMRVQQASFDNAKGVFLDATMKFSSGGAPTTTINRANGAVNNSHMEALNSLIAASLSYAVGLSDDMERAAQSGRCVNLKADTTPATRTNLSPSAPVKIVASPRSAVDGTFTAATVTAKLTGGSSINPLKAAADASFDYVAPAEAGKASSVYLESRSRRGVGMATLSFTTGQVVTRYDGRMTGQSGIPGAVLTQIEIDQITWTLKEGNQQESLVYTPSGAARVTLTMAGCSVTRTLAIDPATSLLLVYGPDERTDGRQKGYFAQVNTVKVQATLSCAIFPQPLAVELMGVFRNGCDSTQTPDPGMPRYTDIQNLAGTRAVGAPCNMISADPHSWSLKAVQP